MNVLQMLQARLMQNTGFGQEEEGGGIPSSDVIEALKKLGLNMPPSAPSAPPALPDYLPDAVRRSILGQPSYAEGQRIPEPWNPAMEQEFGARFGPQRDAELWAALDQAQSPDRIMWDSNAWLNSYYNPSNNRYPSPLNSMMGRFPLALY